MPVCSRIGRKAPNKGSSTFPLTSLAAFFVSPPPSPSRLARVGCPSPLPLHCSPGLLLPAAAPTAHRLHHLLPRCPLPHCNAPCLVEPVDRRPPHISASANKNSIPVQHQHARIITHCSGMPAPTNKSIESVCLSPPLPPPPSLTPLRRGGSYHKAAFGSGAIAALVRGTGPAPCLRLLADRCIAAFPAPRAARVRWLAHSVLSGLSCPPLLAATPRLGSLLPFAVLDSR